ncbi:MAG: hypothetical protein M3N13_10565, partial [Candidatus Eremiobacteraeota bacterium]|nr:hypothetical protein [Candidatus Eremiobacteraeota bacterium]
MGGNSFSLTASAINRAWLNPNNTWTVVTDTSTVAGAIFFGRFQTNSAGVIGSQFVASVGVTKVGVGNFNVGNHPVPTVTGTTIVQVASTIPTSQDVQITTTVTNVPQDQSVAKAIFYYRVYTSGTPLNAWIPAPEVNLSGGSMPAASQVVTATVSQLDAGLTYDFAIAYAGPADFGPLAIVGSNFAVKTLVITAPYLSQMTAAAPTYGTAATVVAGPSPNGTNVSATITVYPNNQPTDSSLIDAHLWFRINGTTNWTDGGALKAAVPAPASATYVFQFSDLGAGLVYDFGLSYEGLSGSTAITPFYVAWSAPSIAITAASFKGVGAHPAPAYAAGGTVNQIASSTPISQDVAISIPFTNVPTDGSVYAAQLYYRVNGTTTWIPDNAVQLAGVPTPPASQTVSVILGQLDAGKSYDFAVAYEAQSDYGPLTQFATNFAVKALSVTTPFLLDGAAQAGPVYAAGGSATAVASANGISAAASIVLNVTNQPQGGSLRKVHLFYRITGGNGVWSDGGYQTAVGAASATPPASATYTWILTDLTAGNTYDFGMAYDSLVGETAITVGISGYVAPALSIGPGSTTFYNLLNSQFAGLTIDSTGNLAMMGGRAIYPSTTAQVMSVTPPPTNLPQFATIYGTSGRMRFRAATSSSQTITFSMLTDAGPSGSTFQNGYWCKYVGNSITFFKRASGVDTQITGTGYGKIYNPRGVIPSTDTNWHTFIFGIIGLSNGNGVTLTASIDGSSAAAYDSAPTPAQIAAFTGNAGPGTIGAGTVLIDRSDFSISIGQKDFSELPPQVGAAIAATANAAGSYVQPGVVTAQALAGAPIGDTGNVLKSTDGTLLLARHDGGVVLDSFGSQVNLWTDSDIKFGFGSGAAYTTLPTNWNTSNYYGYKAIYYYVPNATTNSTYGGAFTVDGLIAVTAGATYTVSALFQGIGALDAGAVVGIQIWDLAHTAVQASLAFNAGTPDGRYSLTFTVAAGVSQLQAYFLVNGTTPSSAGKNVFFSQFQIELGSIATSYKPNTSNHSAASFMRNASHPDYQNTVNPGGGI